MFTTAAVNEQSTGYITTVFVYRAEKQSCIYMEISVRVGPLCVISDNPAVAVSQHELPVNS